MGCRNCFDLCPAENKHREKQTNEYWIEVRLALHPSTDKHSAVLQVSHIRSSTVLVVAFLFTASSHVVCLGEQPVSNHWQLRLKDLIQTVFECVGANNAPVVCEQNYSTTSATVVHVEELIFDN